MASQGMLQMGCVRKRVSNDIFVFLISFLFVVVPISNAKSQIVDFAMEVCDGFCITDIKIKVCDGFCIADETWRVAGACSNFPDVKVGVCDGFCIADKTIKICDGFCIADRTVCVSNARSLKPSMLRTLGLID